MSGSLSEFCAWAAGLSARDVPAPVTEAARLQHLHLTGSLAALQALPSRTACGTGAAGELSAALLYHLGDHGLGGRVSISALPTIWAAAPATVDELVLATVVANEAGGRAGLLGALEKGPGEVDTRALRVGAAAARAKLEGQGAAAFSATIEKALEGGRTIAAAELANPSAAAVVAAEVLGAATGKAPAEALPVWGAAGRTWITESVALPRFPGGPGQNVGLDALDVVLQRHLRAGEKRLRADQVERIELRVAMGTVPEGLDALPAPARASWSFAEAAALLVVHHELGPEWAESGASGDRNDDVAGLASRVSVIHDWRLSARRARRLAEALGPVLGPSGLARLLGAARPHLSGIPAAEALLPLLKERPWAGLLALRKGGGFEACDVVAARSFPTEIRVFTTRGGSWPERRQGPTGMGTERAAAARAAYCNDARAERLLAAPGSSPAAAWLAELRA